MANSARIDELRKKFDENPRRYFAPLANEYRKSGDLEQAVFICQEYLPQQPGHMSGHIVFGQALFEMKRHDEAQAVFETALSLDPENLIALRHLGDIARLMGDQNAARIWYQRVLEADPRNEEIAQVMMSLLATPDPQPVVSSTAVTPRMTPTVPPPADPFAPPVRPTQATPPTPPSYDRATPEQSGFAVEKSDNEPLSAPPRTPTSAPTVEDSQRNLPPDLATASRALDGHAFLDLNDLNLGGVPLQPALAADDLAPASRADDTTTDSEPASEAYVGDGAGESLLDLPFIEASVGELTAPWIEPAAPSTERAQGDEPVGELLPDAPSNDDGFNLGQEDGPFEADSFAIAAGSSSREIAEPEGELQSEREPESTIELAADIPLGLPGDGVSSDLTPAAPTFVTETMAELYLQQGHVESALGIYLRLVEQRPDDIPLRERLNAVEARVHGRHAAVAEPAVAGPTIREFLAGMLARRASSGVTTPRVADEQATSELDMPTPERPPSSSSETVSGSIDALFSGADASPTDLSAATTLQEAFATDGPEPTPLQGVPAHRASSELSLDHVFKGNTPPPPDTDGFSFDQFFAEEMSDPAAGTPGDRGASAGAVTEDIAQFNAWLNGLKKT